MSTAQSARSSPQFDLCSRCVFESAKVILPGVGRGVCILLDATAAQLHTTHRALASHTSIGPDMIGRLGRRSTGQHSSAAGSNDVMGALFPPVLLDLQMGRVCIMSPAQPALPEAGSANLPYVTNVQ